MSTDTIIKSAIAAAAAAIEMGWTRSLGYEPWQSDIEMTEDELGRRMTGDELDEWVLAWRTRLDEEVGS